MKKVEIYTWQSCPFCIRAKRLLDSKGVQYEEHSIDGDNEARRVMVERSDGRSTVPQIFIDGDLIGGYEEFAELHRAGKLEVLR